MTLSNFITMIPAVETVTPQFGFSGAAGRGGGGGKEKKTLILRNKRLFL
jgi:hypothetical protein